MSDANIVIWSRDRVLRWSDFKAEFNPAVFQDAQSVIKFKYTWTINSSKINDDILFSILKIVISVEFQSLLSWVRALQADDNLLKHEQGRFDLAEMVRRENIKRINDAFCKKLFPTRGKNDEQCKQFAKVDSGEMIRKKIDDLKDVFLQKSKEYDRYTNFGHDLERQSEYNERFDKLKS